MSRGSQAPPSARRTRQTIGLLTADWRMGDGATLRLLANLSDQAISHAPDGPAGTLIWGSELGDSVPPWTVLWRIG